MMEFQDFNKKVATLRKHLDWLGIPHDGQDKISCLDPNHEDTDPSMHIYDDHLFCYGCGKYLDVIGLVMECNNCSFKESLEWIAEHSGLPVPILDPEAEKVYLERRNINETYERIFQDSLKNCAAAEDYLNTRGIPKNISQGMVGYLPPDYFPSDEDASSRAGLISNSGKFSLSGYIIFPIRKNGKIEDLYARFLGEIEEKYKHLRPAVTDPPRPPCFWNLDTCKTKKFDELYLTEGIIKGLSLIAKGRENVIAMIGTQGLSKGHIDLLKQAKITKVIFIFDTDSNGSGQKAAFTHARTLFIDGFSVKIITLPKNEDASKIDLDEYFINLRSAPSGVCDGLFSRVSLGMFRTQSV